MTVTRGPATLDELAQTVKSGVERIGKKFTEPDDDWDQVMFIQSPKGITIVNMSEGAFASGASKDVLAAMLRELVAASGAYRFALLLNTHQVTNEDITPEQFAAYRRGEMRLSELPGAKEMLILNVSDAETQQFWTARIERTRKGLRTVRSWKAGGDLEATGRFAGLNEALR